MLDHQLEKALRRKTAPPGFEERVLRRIADSGNTRRPTGVRRWIRPAALGLAASLLLGIAGLRYASDHRAAQAERNRQMVETALRVVSETLQAVQVKVAKASAIRGENNGTRQQ
jgi:hypothetical protein